MRVGRHRGSDASYDSRGDLPPGARVGRTGAEGGASRISTYKAQSEAAAHRFSTSAGLAAPAATRIVTLSVRSARTDHLRPDPETSLPVISADPSTTEWLTCGSFQRLGAGAHRVEFREPSPTGLHSLLPRSRDHPRGQRSGGESQHSGRRRPAGQHRDVGVPRRGTGTGTGAKTRTRTRRDTRVFAGSTQVHRGCTRDVDDGQGRRAGSVRPGHRARATSRKESRITGGSAGTRSGQHAQLLIGGTASPEELLPIWSA